MEKNKSIYSSDCLSLRLKWLKIVSILCVLVFFITSFSVLSASADGYSEQGDSMVNTNTGRTYSFSVDTSAFWFQKSGTSFLDIGWVLSAPIQVVYDSASRSAYVTLRYWTGSNILDGGTYTLGSYMNSLGNLGFNRGYTFDNDLATGTLNVLCGGSLEILNEGVVIDAAQASFFTLGSDNYGIDVNLYFEEVLIARIRLQFNNLYGVGGAYPNVSFFNESASEIEAIIEQRVKDETTAYKQYIDALYDAKIQASRDEWYGEGYQDAEDALGTPYTFKALFNAVFETPLRFVYSLLNFDFLGINVFSIATATLTVIIVFAIIKIIGGIIL